jgi:hypothetical protein
MTKTRFVWQLYGRAARARGLTRVRVPPWPARRAHTPVPLRPNLVFVITFRKKLSPGPKNGLESLVSRFSTICEKNHVLKLKIDEVTVIRVNK